MLRILTAVLWLYPHSFRVRLGPEWLRTSEELVGLTRGLARVRAFVRITADSLLALPEAYRQQRDDQASWWRQMGWEARQAGRALVRRPRFTFTCVLVLAIGIGVNTAVFSVANAALLRPLPYSDPDRLVVVWGDWRAANFTEAPLSPPQWAMLADTDEVFDNVGGGDPMVLGQTLRI